MMYDVVGGIVVYARWMVMYGIGEEQSSSLLEVDAVVKEGV